jgi:hypothetical protein
MTRFYFFSVLLVLFFLFAGNVIAHESVVVIPLNSTTGDAGMADVLKGKTFSSSAGKGITGTRPASPPAATGQTVSYRPGDNGTYQPGETISSRWFNFVLTGYGNTDNLTGLIWTPVGEYMDVESWNSAVDYCQSLVTGNIFLGYKNWRLPTIKELQSLVDYSRNSPALPVGSPNILPSTTSHCWSSTTSSSNSAEAFYINFGNGSSNQGPKTNAFYAICVRGDNLN